MLNRDDLLRIARIINYNRYLTPSLGMLNTSSFKFEYVQFSVHRPLDTGGYCIIHQQWKKAIVGSANDPHINTKEMTEKIQNNEVRIRKEMKTSELKTILETLPLNFIFEDGTNVIVLPKFPFDTKTDPHEVYIKWNDIKDLYIGQYNIDPNSELHKKWFNSGKVKSSIGKDWRYLLNLEPLITEDTSTNELYNYFEGVYTGDVEELKKGTELYNKETAFIETKQPKKRIRLSRDLRPKSNPRINHAPERQEMVCIQDPDTGIIFRINKYCTGSYITKGWKFVSKEDYKIQQRLKFEKRKDMTEGNREEQMLKYKGPKDPNKPKGIPGSPYQKIQVIKEETPDKEDPDLVAQETIKVKRLIPQYEYIPIVWEVWSYRKETYEEIIEDRKGFFKTVIREKRWKDKLLETIPFLNKKGEPLKRKRFVENKIEYITIIRDVKPTYKAIKVLQIPSKKTQELQTVLKQVRLPKRTDGKPLLSIVRDYTKRYNSEEWPLHFTEFKAERQLKAFLKIEPIPKQKCKKQDKFNDRETNKHNRRQVFGFNKMKVNNHKHFLLLKTQ